MAKKEKASTQDHLDIENITDDLVILKTGWVALVMSTTAVNFDLLSEAEQDATIYAYGAFLNSLSFPIEVLVRSKKADITSYFQRLEEAENSQQNPDLKRQIQKYKDFIQSTVQQKTVLDKKFYLIVNYSPLEAGFAGLRGKKQNQKDKTNTLVDAKNALMPKRDHVIKQTSRLGLITKQLTTQELIELFYDIYNPAPTGTQRVLLDTESYTTPIVEPALEIPAPAPAAFNVPPPTASNITPPPTTPPPAQVPVDVRPVPIPQAPANPNANPNPAWPQQQAQQPPISQPPFTAVQNQSAYPAPANEQQPQSQQPSPYAPPASSPISQNLQVQQPVQNTNIPTPQQDALKSLQEATAKAAQFVNSQPNQNPNIPNANQQYPNQYQAINNQPNQK